jgi:transposase
MLQTQPLEANFRHTEEPGPGDFSSADVARLLSENAGLREALRSLRAQGIADRQTAHYYQTMHRKAVERLVEKDQQIEALKSKVIELNHRLFGRKSERKQPKSESVSTAAKRPRGQQLGAVGHGRRVREKLPVVEIEIEPPAEQIYCADCGKPWEALGEPEVSERIEWEVRVVRHRIKRNKYCRPKGCRCKDGRGQIVCAPPPVSLIPKGLLGVSFIVQALLLKFLYAMPLHRILAMVRSEGMPLSAGTLCGVFQTITPLLLPLYNAIFERSRQEDLALMDETRWAIFIEEKGKMSHRWWLWVVVTGVTRLYILSPSRSGAVPKDYFGYDEDNGQIAFHKQVMVDRYSAYAFLKDLLSLAYCWAHVRRDFLEARSEEKDRPWADAWVARIGALYTLNETRLALGCQQGDVELPAPFVQLDPKRMKSCAYQKAHERVLQAVEKLATIRAGELEDESLRTRRRKVLQSMEAHWDGLTLFVKQPQIPMDNNGAERAVRPAAIARKNFYGSGSKWSGDLLVRMMTLLQTLLLHKIDPRVYLTAYFEACANNGSLPPTNTDPWMPWNFSTSPSAAKEGTLDTPQPNGSSP